MELFSIIHSCVRRWTCNARHNGCQCAAAKCSRKARNSTVNIKRSHRATGKFIQFPDSPDLCSTCSSPAPKRTHHEQAIRHPAAVHRLPGLVRHGPDLHSSDFVQRLQQLPVPVAAEDDRCGPWTSGDRDHHQSDHRRAGSVRPVQADVRCPAVLLCPQPGCGSPGLDASHCSGCANPICYASTIRGAKTDR